MKDQKYVRFPKEVRAMLDGNYRAMLHGDYEGVEEMVVPLFRELSSEEEGEFRAHARANYRLGDEIDDIFHPIWKDEANLMNEEASI